MIDSKTMQSPTRSEHIVTFYDESAHLYEAVAGFLADGIAEGEPCVIIATPEHTAGVLAQFRTAGLNSAALEAAGRLRHVDARETLTQFMVGELPDPVRFRSVIGDLLTDVSGGSGRSVRAFGEMVNLLWIDGNPAGAIRLEELWEGLARDREFSLLCAYAMGNFYREVHGRFFEQICSHHSRVLPAEAASLDVAAAPPGAQVALLQQRTLALESEVAQREELEQALRRALAEQREAEQRLRDRELELRDFVENAVEGLHWVGPDGTVLWANRAELELLGYDESEYIGRHIADFHVDRDVIDDILQQLHAGEVIREREARMRCRDGSVRTVVINSNALWQDGRFVHTRCFTRDVTDRKRAELALHEARDEAERANRAKSEFLAVMSHELRTPLNAILGYGDLLDQEVGGPATRQQRTYYARIRHAAQHLLHLIEQILNLSRIEAGKEQFDIENVDVAGVIREAATLVEPTAAAKGVALRVATPPRPIRCETDRNRLRQIVLNLVSNAVKFTDRGHVDVRVRVSGASLIVEVADTGDGIPAEDLDRIFEPFVQVDSTMTRRHGGTGLGLSVSRNLARALGGELLVSSTVGVGSVFTLELPAGTADAGVVDLVARRVAGSA